MSPTSFNEEVENASALLEASGPIGIMRSGLDYVLGFLLLFGAVFGPWAFGTTQPWSIQLMTSLGLSAWVILGMKWLLGRINAAWQPRWWGTSTHWRRRRSEELWFTWAFGLLTSLVLFYCLVSALNARATLVPQTWTLEYHSIISWLPHSYDRESTWRAFWLYSGVAGFFWAARSWILTGAELERAEADSASSDRPALPRRLRLLLWVLSVNGGLLALEAIIQRLSGTNRLLWLVVPRINNQVLDQFGPYAYRANAAQYFNLLWPVTLGFWWSYQQARPEEDDAEPGEKSRKHHLLLPCTILMAICPIMSTSRGGAIIMVALAALSGLVLLLAHWRSTWLAKLGILALFGSMVGGGALLGWEELAPRLEMMQQGFDSREGLFLTGWRMATAEPVFGTGPGTFSSLYPLFQRMASDYWPAQQHNDWLETFITFGGVGSGLLILGLMLLVARSFSQGRIQAEPHFVLLIWIGLIGCLIHAWYDFPLQVHSILTLFLLLCSVVSCLARRA